MVGSPDSRKKLKLESNHIAKHPRPQGHLCFQDGGWAWRRPWRTAGHGSPKILEILIVSKWRRARDWLILWSRDLLFAILNAEKTLGTRLIQAYVSIDSIMETNKAKTNIKEAKLF